MHIFPDLCTLKRHQTRQLSKKAQISELSKGKRLDLKWNLKFSTVMSCMRQEERVNSRRRYAECGPKGPDPEVVT